MGSILFKGVQGEGSGRTDAYGWAWICTNYPKCDAYVGCHPKTRNPLGRLANSELRIAKSAAHKLFDGLWKAKIRRDKVSKSRARGAGYKWLSEKLGVNPKECHIGMMDLDLCTKVVDVCKPYVRTT